MANNEYPEIRDDATDAERLAAIRALMDNFAWEFDDRHYALEAIERYAGQAK